MRPAAARQAEILYSASIAIMIVVAAATWNATVAAAGFALTVALNTFIVGISVLLLILTTRARSRIALWLLVVLTGIGVAGYLWQVASGLLSVGVLAILTSLQTGTAMVAIVLLLRRSSRHWLATGSGDIGDDA